MHLATKSYFHIQRMHNDLRAFLITHLIQAIESFYLCYTTKGVDYCINNRYLRNYSEQNQTSEKHAG